jgi:hypothetical protein
MTGNRRQNLGGGLSHTGKKGGHRFTCPLLKAAKLKGFATSWRAWLRSAERFHNANGSFLQNQ